MVDYIKRLEYLRDNTAEPDDREALSKAIAVLQRSQRNEKMYAVKKKLDAIEYTDPELTSKIEEATKELVYPEQEWIPCNLRDILANFATDSENSTVFKFPNAILDKPLHIFEDDGMGYGVFNAYAFSGYVDCDEARIWI